MIKPRKALLGALTAVLVTVSAEYAGSTTVLKMSDEDLAGNADTILIGKCVGQESRWSEDRTRIVTEYAFEASEILKGDRSRAIVRVVLPGGMVGNRGFYIPGSANFRPGEEVFAFFTEAGPTGECQTVGLSQGKFTIQIDAEENRKVLTRDLRGLTHMNDESGQLVEFSRETEHGRYLDAFKAKVQAIVGEAPETGVDIGTGRQFGPAEGAGGQDGR